MVIGLLTVDLQIPASGSLKDKRQVVWSLVAHLRREHNISIAEVDHLDSWQLCTLAVVCVSGEATHVQQVMQAVAEDMDRRGSEYIVLDVRTELL
jgi:uncharacterized protein YlxP (DUF503 family)